MKKKANILNIANNYNLKLLFSYIDYEYTLKLIKNNKQLQNRLDIKIDNNKYYSNFPNPEIREYKEVKNYKNKNNEELFNNIFKLSSMNLFFIFFLPIFDYTKKTENFFYILMICYSLLYLGFFSLVNGNVIDKLKVEKGFLIALNIFNILFEYIIIKKFAFTYEIKDNNYSFMVLYVFLFIKFIYDSYIFFKAYIYFKYEIIPFKINMHYYLTSLNNIKIDEYEISNNLIKMNDKEKKKFFLKIYKNMKYHISKNQKDLIILINDFRKNNNLNEFSFKEFNKIPNLIMKEPSKMMLLYSWVKIFKLSNKKYLFKYHVNEFENKFKNKDKKIINILLKNNLNYLKIINKGNNEYILVYHKKEY